MDISEFALRTTLLAMPGLVACKILEAMTGRRYADLWRVTVDALLFATLSYLTLALLIVLVGGPPSALNFLTSNAAIDWAVVAGATLIALVIAALWTCANRQRLLYRCGVRFGLTRRTSDDDVWSEFLDSAQDGEPKHDWYFVRDHSKQLLYYGAIVGWSDAREPRELALGNVSVCDGRTGRVMFKAERLYLAADAQALTIEVRPEPTTSSELSP